MLPLLTQRSSRRLSALLVAAVCVLAGALAAPVASADAPGGPGFAAPVSAQDAPGGAAAPGAQLAPADVPPALVVGAPPEPVPEEVPAPVPADDSSSVESVSPQPTVGAMDAPPPAVPAVEASLPAPSEEPPLPEVANSETADPPPALPALLQNISLSIRILSPGDDGGVSQGIVVPGLDGAAGDALAGGGWDWTWTWNWTWDSGCGPGDAAVPASTGGAGWNWTWNWDWTCGSDPAPTTDPSQRPAHDPAGGELTQAAPQGLTPQQPPIAERTHPQAAKPPAGHAPTRAKTSPPLAASAPAAVRSGSLVRMPSPVADSLAAPTRAARASAGAPPGPDPAGGPPDDPPTPLAGVTTATASGGGGGGSVLLAAFLCSLILLIPRASGRVPQHAGRLRLPSGSSRLERPG